MKKTGVLMVLFLLLLVTWGRGLFAVPAPDSAHALSRCPPIEEEIIDLNALADMLKNTKAVGLVTKIALKGDISALLKRMEVYHRGKRTFSLEELQEQYDLLLMKIASHLQDKDLALHKHLCNAWFVIWEDLRDEQRFREFSNG